MRGREEVRVSEEGEDSVGSYSGGGLAQVLAVFHSDVP